MNSITMPDFLKLYPGVSGMTGTAITSADEFLEIYGLETVLIPTNRPCIRVDYPDSIYLTKEAKHKALIDDIACVNAKGRPVLVGTRSIVESELIADMLRGRGINCNILNAKNDEYEAAVVAKAGALSAVTVSTNMAGRGTDIKLGGPDEKDRDKVSELGGLYVVATSRHESARIDNQLRGRAGRQGDPGSSKFYISLEDDLPVMFNVAKKARLNLQSLSKEQPVNTPRLEKEVLRAQRAMENQNFDIRRTLCKYSEIVELHRKIMQRKRAETLEMSFDTDYIMENEPAVYKHMVERIGRDAFLELERDITLCCIDQCWADYLEQVACIRDGIHLVMFAGQNPLEQYCFKASELFEELCTDMYSLVTETIKGIVVTENGVNGGIIDLKGPSATWTYLLNDDPFDNDLGLMLASARNIGMAAFSASFPLTAPVLIGSLIYQRQRRNRHID